MKEREAQAENLFFLWFHQCVHAGISVSWKENPLLILIIMLAFVWHFTVYAVCTFESIISSRRVLWEMEGVGEQGSWLLWGLR